MQIMRPMQAVTMLLVAAALTSCGSANTPEPTQDVNVIHTSVAGTMVSQLYDQQTQTAQAVPPSPAASPTALDTSTPLPTFLATALNTPIIINTPAGAVFPTNPVGGGPRDRRRHRVATIQILFQKQHPVMVHNFPREKTLPRAGHSRTQEPAPGSTVFPLVFKMGIAWEARI